MKPIEQLSDTEFSALVRDAVALPDAPPALVRRALDQWAARPVTLADAGKALLRQLFATLSFDSWAGGALAHGVRSMPSDTRHLLFSAEGRDIDLRIAPAGNGYAVTGQVLGPDETGAIELAAAPGAARHDATLDALGEFRIDGVAPGAYVLTLRLGDATIELPRIDVGGRDR